MIVPHELLLSCDVAGDSARAGRGCTSGSGCSSPWGGWGKDEIGGFGLGLGGGVGKGKEATGLRDGALA